MKSFLLVLALTLLASPSARAASWSEGKIAEGDNAYTVGGGSFRLSLLGRSAVGLTDHLELSAYLATYLLLLPNLALKYRIVEADGFGLALKAGASAGLFPFGIVFGQGAAAGFITATAERVEAIASVTAARTLTLSLRGGAVFNQTSAEIVSTAGAASGSISGRGLVAGPEVDLRITDDDAVVLDLEYYNFPAGHFGIMPPILSNRALVGFAGYYHSFHSHVQSAIGLYAVRHYGLLFEAHQNSYFPHANLAFTF